MTANTAARWPSAPDDIRSLTGDDHFDAAAENVLHECASDFRHVSGRTDGSRSLMVAKWTALIFAAVGGEQP